MISKVYKISNIENNYKLSKNEIFELEGLETLKDLKILNLAENHISEIK